MFDYKNTNTDLAHKYGDIELLKRIESLDLMTGWGLVAEVCKRFEQLCEFITKQKQQSDLEKFIELYRSVGIELEPVICEDKSYGYQYLRVEYDSWEDHEPDHTRIMFDDDGKFIRQATWS